MACLTADAQGSGLTVGVQRRPGWRRAGSPWSSTGLGGRPPQMGQGTKLSHSGSAADVRVFAAPHTACSGKVGGFPQHCCCHSRAVGCSWFPLLTVLRRSQKPPLLLFPPPSLAAGQDRLLLLPLQTSLTPFHALGEAPCFPLNSPSSLPSSSEQHATLLHCPSAPQLLSYRQLCCGHLQGEFCLPCFWLQGWTEKGPFGHLLSGEKGSQG